MPFVALTTAETASGKPITQALMRKIKDDLDDLDQRAAAQTGDVAASINPTIPTGWILIDEGTIGSALSGATNRANADAEDLFKVLWDNYANSEAPVFDSLGAAVSRGVSAQADWNANRRIQIGTLAGRVPGISGQGSGLTNRTSHTVTGAESVSADLAGHIHSISVNDGGSATSGVGGASGGSGGSANTNSTGAGGGHNNVQPTAWLVWRVKL